MVRRKRGDDKPFIEIHRATYDAGRVNRVAFATAEGLLPMSTYSLITNLGKPTFAKRAKFAELCRERGFTGETGQAITFTAEELAKAGLGKQTMGRGYTFTVIGMGSEPSTLESVRQLGEQIVHALGAAITSGQILTRGVWEDRRQFRVTFEYRMIREVFDQHVADNLNGVRQWPALTAMLEGIVAAVAKLKDQETSAWHDKNSADGFPTLAFYMSMGFGCWAEVDRFNQQIVPAVIEKYEKMAA